MKVILAKIYVDEFDTIQINWDDVITLKGITMIFTDDKKGLGVCWKERGEVKTKMYGKNVVVLSVQ